MKNGLRCDDIVAQQDSLTHKTFHKLFIPVNSNLDLLILISRSKPIEPYNEMKTATEGLIKKRGKNNGIGILGESKDRAERLGKL